MPLVLCSSERIDLMLRPCVLDRYNLSDIKCLGPSPSMGTQVPRGAILSSIQKEKVLHYSGEILTKGNYYEL